MRTTVSGVESILPSYVSVLLRLRRKHVSLLQSTPSDLTNCSGLTRFYLRFAQRMMLLFIRHLLPRHFSFSFSFDLFNICTRKLRSSLFSMSSRLIHNFFLNFLPLPPHSATHACSAHFMPCALFAMMKLEKSRKTQRMRRKSQSQKEKKSILRFRL